MSVTVYRMSLTMRKTIFNTVNLNRFLSLFDNYTITYTRYMN